MQGRLTVRTTCAVEHLVPDATGAELGTLLPIMGSTCPTGYSAHPPPRADRGPLLLRVHVRCRIIDLCHEHRRTWQLSMSRLSDQRPFVQHEQHQLSAHRPRCQCAQLRGGSFTDCTASGTAKPSSPQWTETRTFCKADRVGEGCSSGSSCVAARNRATNATPADSAEERASCGACQALASLNDATIQV